MCGLRFSLSNVDVAHSVLIVVSFAVAQCHFTRREQWSNQQLVHVMNGKYEVASHVFQNIVEGQRVTSMLGKC